MFLDLVRENTLNGVNLIGVSDFLESFSDLLVSVAWLQESEGGLGLLVSSQDDISLSSSNDGVLSLANNGVGSQSNISIEMDSEINLDNISVFQESELLILFIGITGEW